MAGFVAMAPDRIALFASFLRRLQSDVDCLQVEIAGGRMVAFAISGCGKRYAAVPVTLGAGTSFCQSLFLIANDGLALSFRPKSL